MPASRSHLARPWTRASSFLTALGVCLTTAGPSRAQECEYPGVLLVVDRSTSMQGTIGGITKWQIARHAITSMVTADEDRIAYGLMIYPGPSGTGSILPDDDLACYPTPCTPLKPQCTTGEVLAELTVGDTSAIVSALASDPQSGAYTPTWQSLRAAGTYLLQTSPWPRRFVVLVTDGWQCCGVYSDNGMQNCSNAAQERFKPVDEVARLLEHGIRTFVVGFSSAVDAQTLNLAAQAGGTARPGCDPSRGSPCYYQANNQAELTGLLDSIARLISQEVCDGLDNDCDGVVDGLTRPCAGACGVGLERCEDGVWLGCDTEAPAPETCNGVDDDCDGEVDEELTRACETACGVGLQHCAGGMWQRCAARVPAPETCNGVDDDCNGEVDEELTRACETACGPGEEFCVEGRWEECTPLLPDHVACNDGDPCTLDRCDPERGCQHLDQCPDCREAAASVPILWPPNHTLREIGVTGVADPQGQEITIQIDRILQDEPTDARGDGNTCPDARGVGQSTAFVRAERSGTPKQPGNGRIYLIMFTASDPDGYFCQGEVQTCVPHDLGFRSQCIDDLIRFDSSSCH